MRIYQRDRRWWVDFSYNGKRYRRSAGRTKRDALLKLGEIQRRIEQEEKRGIPATAPRSFAEYAKEYLEYSQVNKASSSYRRDTVSTKLLLATFGEYALPTIQAKEIERYKELRRKKVSPATVNRELGLLKNMFHKAIDWGYTKEDPARTVRLFKEPPGRTRYLLDNERERLLDACKHSDSPMLYPVVFTALNTGMRKGELANLTWDGVDLVERIITVKRSKNNEVRIIQINASLLSMLLGLREQMPHSYYVFSKLDGTAYGNWRRSFDTVCRQAGINDFRFHDLRHTFASYLAMEGRSPFEIMALTGHKTLAMVTRYTHISEKCLRAAVDAIGTKMAQFASSSVEKSHK